MSRARKTEYKKSEASRGQVLDAAIAVFADKGIASTSIQDIADAAGLSKGAVHYHFESKEELLQRVLDRCCELVETRVRAVFEAEGPPLDRIRNALAEMWRMRRDGDREMRVLIELHLLARQNPRIREAFAAALERARQQIIDTGLAYLAVVGMKPKVPVHVIPRLIIATLDGLNLQHEIEPISRETEDELIATLEALVFAVLER